MGKGAGADPDGKIISRGSLLTFEFTDPTVSLSVGGTNVKNATFASNTANIIVIERTSGEIFLHQNGTTDSTGVADTTNFTGSDTLAFGKAPLDSANFFLVESVIGTTLTTARRNAIEGYLAHTYSITSQLPSDHPFKTSAPTFDITGAKI
jgi:hypothetical protein